MDTISRSIPVTRPYKLPLESNKWGGVSTAGTSNNSISVNTDVIFDFVGTTPYSICTTISPIFYGAYGRIVSKEFSDVNGRQGWLLFTENLMFGTRLGIERWKNNSGAANYTNKLFINNKLLHFAATYDGTNIRSYINGKLENTQVSAQNLIGNNKILTIFNNPANSGRYRGQCNDMAIFLQTLTQPQIQDLMYGRILPTQFDCRLWHDYRLGHARDLSGNGNHGTLNGNVRFV